MHWLPPPLQALHASPLLHVASLGPAQVEPGCAGGVTRVATVAGAPLSGGTSHGRRRHCSRSHNSGDDSPSRAREGAPIPGSGCEKARGPAAQGRMFRRLLNDGDRLPTSAGKERACEAALRTGSGNAGFCAMYRDGIAPGSDGRSSRDLEGHTRRRPAFPAILPS